MTGDILARLQAAQSDAEREWVVMEWSLANLEPEVRAAVWAAAIPHWFDLDYLAALLDRPAEQARPVFERLITLSYVEVFPGRGHNVHERTRALLLDRLWQDDPARFRALSRRAADFAARQDQEDVTWRVEGLFHRVISGEEGIADVIDAQAIAWYNRFEFGKLEALARVILEAIQAGRVADSRVKAICFEALGDVHVMLSEYPAARARYEEAQPIYRAIGARLGEANCIQALGDVHVRLAEYPAARARYEEAQPIYRAIGDRLGEANCYLGLADVDRREELWAVAAAGYERALAYYRSAGMPFNIALALQRLGYTARGAGDLDRAQRYFEEALAIFQYIGSPLAGSAQNDLEELRH